MAIYVMEAGFRVVAVDAVSKQEATRRLTGATVKKKLLYISGLDCTLLPVREAKASEVASWVVRTRSNWRGEIAWLHEPPMSPRVTW